MVAPLTLVIGNKNYSSWSLRPWLAMKVAGIDFDEIVIPLDTDDFAETITRYSPAGRVPVLIKAGQPIWDSLAILEWAAEQQPTLLPGNDNARAHARSVMAEMHSGFAALRTELPMNIRRTPGPIAVSAQTIADIGRIQGLWQSAHEHFGGHGPFLFGDFTAADAMFAPVVTRFLTYQIELSQPAQIYCQAVMGLPAMQEWVAAAHVEPWILPDEEL